MRPGVEYSFGRMSVTADIVFMKEKDVPSDFCRSRHPFIISFHAIVIDSSCDTLKQFFTCRGQDQKLYGKNQEINSRDNVCRDGDSAELTKDDQV